MHPQPGRQITTWAASKEVWPSGGARGFSPSFALVTWYCVQVWGHQQKKDLDLFIAGPGKGHEDD